MGVLDYLFDFGGRIPRSYFWLFVVLSTVSGLAAIGADYANGSYHPAFGIGTWTAIVMLALQWPSWAIGAKRLHDMDHSGWWQLISIIPYAGALGLVIWLGFFPGTKGNNSFGEPLSYWQSDEHYRAHV